MSLLPAYGGAPFAPHTKKVIRLLLKGCVNRPFFLISVQEEFKEKDDPVIEQLGNYDPLPNENNEKLVAINFERLEFWLQQGADMSTGVKKLLGLSGYLPVHHLSFEEAFRRRKCLMKEIENLKIKAAEFNISAKESESPEELPDTAASTPEESCSTSAEEPNDHEPDDKGDPKS